MMTKDRMNPQAERGAMLSKALASLLTQEMHGPKVNPACSSTDIEVCPTQGDVLCQGCTVG